MWHSSNRPKLTHTLDSIAEALLLPSGIDGVYARTAVFEQVVNGLTDLIAEYREPNTEVLRFPPVMSRRQVEKSGYLKSFPALSRLRELSVRRRRRNPRGG